MASLFIKDPVTADLVTRVARKAGMTKTALVRDLAEAREAEIDRAQHRATIRERLDAWRAAHPLPPPTGREADKAFFDAMWGEDPDLPCSAMPPR